MAKDDKKSENGAEDAAADAKETGAAAPSAQPSAAGNGKPPSVAVQGQYVKDLSFEVPGAPKSLLDLKGQMPPLNLQIAVQVKPFQENEFDVEIRIEARGGTEGAPVFNLELVYGGLFRIENVPTEQLHPYVHVECPRILFPFVRQIIAETVSSSGLPPIMLQPIDFAALYRQRLQQMAQQKQQAGETTNA